MSSFIGQGKRSSVIDVVQQEQSPPKEMAKDLTKTLEAPETAEADKKVKPTPRRATMYTGFLQTSEDVLADKAVNELAELLVRAEEDNVQD